MDGLVPLDALNPNAVAYPAEVFVGRHVQSHLHEQKADNALQLSKSLTGQAIGYALSQRAHLSEFNSAS